MVKNKLGATVLAATLVCACQSISKKQTAEPFPSPPAGLEGTAVDSGDPVAQDHALERHFRDNPTEPMRYLVRYLQAKLWTPIDEVKACALWLEVSENPRFPLLRLARLHAIETCPATRPEIPPILLNEAGLPQDGWIKEASTRAQLARAVRGGDKPVEMKLSMEVARLERLQTEQLKLLNRSRQLAKDLKDTATDQQALEQIEKIAPRFIPDPKPEQYLTVANDFKRAREFDSARLFYKKVVGGDFTDYDKLRALDGIRMSFKLEQKREKFVEGTRAYSDFARDRFLGQPEAKKSRKAAQQKPSPRVLQRLAKYLETRLTLARAVWTEGSAREAEEILGKVEQELKGRYPLEEILFLRARINEEAGHLDRAVDLLLKIDDQKLPDRATRLKVAWFRAWTLRKVNRLPEAAALLKRLARDEAQTPQEARDRFWLARINRDMGDQLEAGAQYAWLMNNDSLGYYGMIAYRELQQPLPLLVAPGTETANLRNPAGAATVAEASPQPPPVAPLVRNDDNLRAMTPEERLNFDWLVAGGEGELARRYLDATASERRANFTDEQLLDFLKAYARAGAYQALFSRLYELKPETRRQILEKQPEFVFPRPWRPLVDGAANKFNVKPEMIFSIMRQESSFNPRARSFADAFGLMQLIPEVADRAGATAGLKIAHPEDLYRPEVNIPLGSAFLHELLTKWGGHFIPAVASYNASEKAVSGWLKTRDRKDPLAFIEDIPYEETKGYVKLVMRNFVFYSRMNPAATNGEPLPFPEWCLNGIQDIKL